MKNDEQPICPKCEGRGDAHKLTCPTLQLGYQPARKPPVPGWNPPSTPNPGSYAALERGCQCPVAENGHGTRPSFLASWHITEGCPMHAPIAGVTQ